jgi:MFS family permease
VELLRFLGSDVVVRSLRGYGARFWLAWLASLLFFAGFYALLLPLPARLEQLSLPAWQIAVIIGAFGVGALIARPAVGVLADTQGRRRLLLASALLGAGAVAGMATATDGLILLGLRLAHAAAYAGFTTAAVALASDLAGPVRRAGALAIFGMAPNLALSITPQFITPALTWFGPSGALLLTSAAMLVAVLPAVAATAPRANDPIPETESGPLPRSRHPLIGPFLGAAGLGLAFGVYLLFVPVLVERQGYGQGPTLYTTYGIGIILIRLLTSRALNGSKRAVLVTAAWVSMAVGLASLAVAPSLLAGIAGSALVAFGGGVLHPALITAHIEALPERRHGFAVAVFYLGFDGGIGLGSWLLAPLFAFVGVASMFVVASAACLTFAIASVLRLLGGARRLPARRREMTVPDATP